MWRGVRDAGVSSGCFGVAMLWVSTFSVSSRGFSSGGPYFFSPPLPSRDCLYFLPYVTITFRGP